VKKRENLPPDGGEGKREPKSGRTGQEEKGQNGLNSFRKKREKAIKRQTMQGVGIEKKNKRGGESEGQGCNKNTKRKKKKAGDVEGEKVT